MRAKLLAVVMLATLLVGCGRKNRDAQSDQPVIGVSLLTLTNPFFRDLGNAIKQEAEAKEPGRDASAGRSLVTRPSLKRHHQLNSLFHR